MEIKEIKNKIDEIFNKGRLVLITVQGKKYEITGYSIFGGYIVLYYGNDNLGTFHIRDIENIKELL